MKKQLLLLSSFIALASSPAFAQLPLQKVSQENSGEVKTHRVAIGETMVIIAKKYMVLPQDIYELNPSAAEGLSAGMMLRIPVGKKVKVGAEEKNLDYEVVDAASIKKQKKQDDSNLGYEVVDASAIKKQKKQDDSNLGYEVVDAASIKKQKTQDDSNPGYVVVDAETILKDRQKKQQEQRQITESHDAGASAYKYSEKNNAVQNVSHEVKPGETLTALARKYNTTIAEITEANEKALKRGLQAGQTLVIPSATGNESFEPSATEVGYAAHNIADDVTPGEIPATHHVKQGETLHSLARKYNTTVAELTAANEKLLKRGLQAGQTLVVPGGTAEAETAVAATEAVIVPNHASYSEEPTGSAEHKVEAGETLHGLARKYSTTVEAITAANKQKLKKGLQAGQLIKIPVPIGIAAVNAQ